MKCTKVWRASLLVKKHREMNVYVMIILYLYSVGYMVAPVSLRVVGQILSWDLVFFTSVVYFA